jgi:transcription initiation factor TFIIIB Brf1 subunit/transcription initiation factor TFIIB
MSILNRIPPSEIYAAAHSIWPQKSLADEVASQAIQILNQTYKRRFAFFNGKSSRYLVGGLFYLLGFRYDAVKRQSELADQLGTSDVTIRKSYRRWLETFPDLFVDIVSKLAVDKDLKYYVLIDLKPNLHQTKSAVS